MKKKKLKLKVPVSWTMAAMVEVEAYDLAEAVEVAKADFAQYGGEFLPEGKFVENSYHVEFEAIDLFQKEDTLDVMHEQMDDVVAERKAERAQYGIGGYIDSEGTVYTAEQSKIFDEAPALTLKVDDKVVGQFSQSWYKKDERHVGLVIGKDGTVEKLA